MKAGLVLFYVRIVLALLGMGASQAFAHSEPYSHLDIRLEPDRVHGKVLAHMVDLAREGGLEQPERLLDPAFAERNLAILHKVLDSHVLVKINSEPVHFQWQAFQIVANRRSLSFEWTVPLSRSAGKVEVSSPLFPYDPPHETYLNIYENGEIRLQDLLDKTHRSANYYSGSIQGKIEVAREFVAQGIHHIFIGPDHILFIIGLLLPGGGLLRLLKIITAFTVAHSVTLALATLKLVNISPAIVEPAIALSIVLVGLETLYMQLRRRDHRVALALVFGLIHGFGFAGVLADFGLPESALGLSLASFNVGVEIGQACIVLIVTPSLMIFAARNALYARRTVYLGTLATIAAGGFWFVQRVMEV
ncbi:HupE/UreJ family protein [Candidatus Methylomicrobium oryzae]|jgi:hydrogenase/urease accessory protein HupE|uniref:HupE/UreJ family protein n=1 Tax=Candidatus Methylomicrobium oryzae TaxID=2802053 RepID=UPI001920F07F|nr:HupE/UreJ family protein [Methylomicrobium sp. RS1]MBL1262598.1 HupE/UreJ family protein [Methylomicrobium sp. RS1]